MPIFEVGVVLLYSITMEGQLESQVTEISQTPGIVGVICTDKQGLSLAARGTLEADNTAGLVSGLATQAQSLKIGTGDDDRPTVVVEFDTGNVMIKNQNESVLAVHKI